MSWWLWLIVGIALLLMELLTPGGFFIIFFGIGAIIVGLLTSAGAAGPIWMQWLLFTGFSLVSLALFRRPLLRWMRAREGEKAPVDAIVGQVAILQEDLPPGGVAKAELRGTAWTARSRGSAPLARGQRCRVETVDGLTLWLRAE